MSGIPGGDATAPVQDPSTPVGMIRLLITDTVEPTLFTDQQLERFLATHNDSVKRAAAAALDVMAVSELFISKKFSSQDLNVDGPAVAKALQATADNLRAQAAAEEEAAASADYGIDVVALYRFDPPPPWANSYL